MPVWFILFINFTARKGVITLPDAIFNDFTLFTGSLLNITTGIQVFIKEI